MKVARLSVRPTHRNIACTEGNCDMSVGFITSVLYMTSHWLYRSLVICIHEVLFHLIFSNFLKMVNSLYNNLSGIFIEDVFHIVGTLRNLVLHTCWGRFLPLKRAAYILLYVIWRLNHFRQICHVGEDGPVSVSYYWHSEETVHHASNRSVACVRTANTRGRRSLLFEIAQLLIKPLNSDHFIVNMYDTFI